MSFFGKYTYMADWRQATPQLQSVHRFDSKIPQYYKPINLSSVTYHQRQVRQRARDLSHTLMLPAKFIHESDPSHTTREYIPGETPSRHTTSITTYLFPLLRLVRSVLLNSKISILERPLPLIAKDLTVLAVGDALDTPHGTGGDVERADDDEEGRG
mmetsp:Transcript_18471/g.40208  ORF Transcript_18471/g.40208 Transcript_18471/m.40208 type:complete len:157 (+) Transcript_18471:46-516(+)